MQYPALDALVNRALQEGTVIPAHPLALQKNRRLDEERQRLLTQYYIASGAGGLAIGVHTTQFAIRASQNNLFETVLRIAAEEISAAGLRSPFIKVAGIIGSTASAVEEARLAARLGYHLGLLSMGGLTAYTEKELITHARKVAEIIPVFGFYLQPAVGGRLLSYRFWREFADLPNVYAIKIAAFNRYQTLDVIRAVCHSERCARIALYTGNDDNIAADLLTPYRLEVDGRIVEKRIVGGLLGHWAVWTGNAVALLREIKRSVSEEAGKISALLATGARITDMNAAVFDAANDFRGCIPGIHYVLQMQGLLKGTWCLDPGEKLSPGQAAEIDRVCRSYPDLTDDAFVRQFISRKQLSQI